MKLTEEQIRMYIKTNCSIGSFHITPTTSLFESGLLDSIQLLGLIEFIEQQADIVIENTEIKLENIDTIEKIIAFVSRG